MHVKATSNYTNYTIIFSYLTCFNVLMIATDQL